MTDEFTRFNTTPRRIKFSSDYFKLPEDVKKAKLLLVIRTTRDKLSPQFIVYDSFKTSGTYYKIPDGELLLLIFQVETFDRYTIFTTVRRRTLRKEQYYKKHIGEVFDVEIGG